MASVSSPKSTNSQILKPKHQGEKKHLLYRFISLATQLSSVSPVELRASSINKSVLKIEHINSEGIQSICTCLENTVKNVQGQIFRKQELSLCSVGWDSEGNLNLWVHTKDLFLSPKENRPGVSALSSDFGANLQQRTACLWKSFPHDFQQFVGGQWLMVPARS